ncbi:MAG: sle [Actinoallomurus sp.]|jgi:SAM-dependent methyltransferase|nr:sle [Actinoallomurus sp.]
MPMLTRRVLRLINRFNAAHPWDHNAFYHRWIMRQLPTRFGRALDVGSGSGDLARLLATRADTAEGIDCDAAIVARARELTDASAPIHFTVGDALTQTPPGPYDVITCVATVHHLPFTDALTNFRKHLAPGGTLVIVGLFRAQSRLDRLLDVVAIPLNLAMGWLKNNGHRPATRPVWMTATTRPAAMAFPEIVREADQVLAGAHFRRRLFWRYSLVWRQR